MCYLCLVVHMLELIMLVSLHEKSPALGAAVAALGLSNKAVYAEDLQDSNGGVASGMEGGNYTDGPDLAPNAAPAAVAGQLTTTLRLPVLWWQWLPSLLASSKDCCASSCVTTAEVITNVGCGSIASAPAMLHEVPRA